MSSPSSRTWPEIPAPTMTSCMRLSVRRKVDFPQPEGPIRAVTRLASTVRVTLSIARVDPYQALTPTASIDLDMVFPRRSCATARVAMESGDPLCRQHDDTAARSDGPASRAARAHGPTSRAARAHGPTSRAAGAVVRSPCREGYGPRRSGPRPGVEQPMNDRRNAGDGGASRPPHLD